MLYEIIFEMVESNDKHVKSMICSKLQIFRVSDVPH